MPAINIGGVGDIFEEDPVGHVLPVEDPNVDPLMITLPCEQTVLLTGYFDSRGKIFGVGPAGQSAGINIKLEASCDGGDTWLPASSNMPHWTEHPGATVPDPQADSDENNNIFLRCNLPKGKHTFDFRFIRVENDDDADEWTIEGDCVLINQFRVGAQASAGVKGRKDEVTRADVEAFLAEG